MRPEKSSEQEGFYQLDNDDKDSPEKVIVRVKQTPRRNLKSGNKSVAVTQGSNRMPMNMQVGSLSSQSDCTFRDMHLVCQSMEQTMKGTNMNKTAVAGISSAHLIGPWTVNRTSEVELASFPEVASSSVEFVDATVDMSG